MCVSDSRVRPCSAAPSSTQYTAIKSYRIDSEVCCCCSCAAFVPWIIKCGYIAKLTLSSKWPCIVCCCADPERVWLAGQNQRNNKNSPWNNTRRAPDSQRQKRFSASSSSAAAAAVSGWPGLSRVRYRIVVDMVMMSPRVPAAAQKQNHLDSKEKLGQLN